MTLTMKKIIVICGPTASGKSALAIFLAKGCSGEIVSADSQQIWRGFDIGTAKPFEEELREVPHHLIDICDPSERFDAEKFLRRADAAIDDISSRGMIPFVVGGTGMYLRMLEFGICEAPESDPALRAELESRAKAEGLAALYEELERVDPQSSSSIHPNDKIRIIRALEIFQLAGSPASEFRSGHEFSSRRYDALKIGLNIEREELYRRIDARVDSMMAAGLLEEVRALLDRYDSAAQPFSAVGYKELVSHLAGEVSLDEAVRLIKRNSRRYAKRQMTWFRADSEIKWFEPLEISLIESEVLQKII
ncbi:MAG: tRNA dimethylallyltransferase [bacterium ADurb.Bin270]|nr:MAG: tRNA dimethylallyltransferase [bacterium ADurb.Bin270]